MAWQYTITNLDTRESSTLLFLSNKSYALPDGSTLGLREEVGWCDVCQNFVHGEVLPSLEEIDAKIKEYAAEKSDAERNRYGWAYKLRLRSRKKLERKVLFAEEALKSWKAWRDWRANRKSPPRCLDCGAPGVKIMILNEPQPDPAGKGQVRAMLTAHVNTASPPTVHYHTEGVRIPSS